MSKITEWWQNGGHGQTVLLRCPAFIPCVTGSYLMNAKLRETRLYSRKGHTHSLSILKIKHIQRHSLATNLIYAMGFFPTWDQVSSLYFINLSQKAFLVSASFREPVDLWSKVDKILAWFYHFPQFSVFWFSPNLIATCLLITHLYWIFNIFTWLFTDFFKFIFCQCTKSLITLGHCNTKYKWSDEVHP